MSFLQCQWNQCQRAKQQNWESFQLRSQGLPGWATRPPGDQNEEENKWNLRKKKKNWSKFEEKMKKVELLPTWDCEAGHATESFGSIREFRPGGGYSDLGWVRMCGPEFQLLPHSKTWPLANSQPISKPHFSTGTHVKTNFWAYSMAKNRWNLPWQ